MQLTEKKWPPDLVALVAIDTILTFWKRDGPEESQSGAHASCRENPGHRTPSSSVLSTFCSHPMVFSSVATLVACGDDMCLHRGSRLVSASGQWLAGALSKRLLWTSHAPESSLKTAPHLMMQLETIGCHIHMHSPYVFWILRFSRCFEVLLSFNWSPQGD